MSNLVVEQVLKARSGRLCIPKSEEGKSGLRNWPIWAQDVAYGHVWQRKEQFGFGTNNDTKLV